MKYLAETSPNEVFFCPQSDSESFDFENLHDQNAITDF